MFRKFTIFILVIFTISFYSCKNDDQDNPSSPAASSSSGSESSVSSESSSLTSSFISSSAASSSWSNVNQNGGMLVTAAAVTDGTYTNNAMSMTISGSTISLDAGSNFSFTNAAYTYNTPAFTADILHQSNIFTNISNQDTKIAMSLSLSNTPLFSYDSGNRVSGSIAGAYKKTGGPSCDGVPGTYSNYINYYISMEIFITNTFTAGWIPLSNAAFAAPEIHVLDINLPDTYTEVITTSDFETGAMTAETNSGSWLLTNIAGNDYMIFRQQVPSVTSYTNRLCWVDINGTDYVFDYGGSLIRQ